jgi:hypothetical protein
LVLGTTVENNPLKLIFFNNFNISTTMNSNIFSTIKNTISGVSHSPFLIFVLPLKPVYPPTLRSISGNDWLVSVM